MIPESLRGRALAELWLLSMGAVLMVYVAADGPLLAMARHLIPLVFALAFILSYAGLGIPLARRLLPAQGPADHLLVGTALGMGLSGLMVFTLGLAGIVDMRVYAVWTLVGLAALPFSAVPLWRSRTRLGIDPYDAFTLLAGAVILVNLLLILPGLVSPPVSTDALEYHLLIPKIILGSGRIAPIPHLVESSYPSLAEYLYLPVLALAGDVACKALHFWAGLGAAAALARLVRRSDPAANPLLPAALFLAMPLVAHSFALAWNDAFFVLFLLLGLGQLLAFHAGNRRRVAPLVVAGLVIGLAAWTKYTVVMVLVALAPVLVLAVLRRHWRWYHPLVVAAPVSVVSLLVFAKNWAFTGNPFYPFLSSVFPNPAWNDAAAAFFHHALRRWEIPDWSWRTYLTFPFRIALTPRIIDTHTGVVPLVLAPLLLVRSATREVRFLKAFVGFSVAAWLVFQTENRSLLTMLAVLLCVAQSGLDGELRRRPFLRRPVVALLAAASLAALGMTALNNAYLTSPLGYFVGAEGRQTYLDHEVPSQPAYDLLNREASVRRVLLVGLHDPYHLDRHAVFSSFSDPPIAETLSRGAGSAGALRKRLLGLGISHVVVNLPRYRAEQEHGLYSWSPRQRQVFESFLREYCEPVATLGPNRVLRIVAPDPG